MKRLLICIIVLLVGLTACDNREHTPIPSVSIASLGTPSVNEIWFVTSDGKDLLEIDQDAFDAEITDIIYSEYDKCVIRFASKITAIEAEAFYGCHNLFNIALPHSVQTIGERAFYDCKNMECISFGNAMRSCKSSAFDGCYNLHSLHIPSVKDWCDISFESKTANPLYFAQGFLVNNAKVSTLEIPESITQIYPYAFYGDSQLRSVKFPASIESIGANAFGECENITKVEIADLPKWCAIEFGDESSNPLSTTGILYVEGVVASAVELIEVEKISAYAFTNCVSITSLTADEALQSVGDNAFRNCSKLASATLGSGVQSIGKQAFMNCGALISVTCNATEPPVLGNKYTFDYNAKERKFYVPSEAIEAYKTNEHWAKYADVIEQIEN